MEITDILTLARAGYTAEQIEKMAAPAKPAEPVKPEVDPVVAAVTAPVVEKVVEPVVAPETNSDPMAAVINQLANLTKAIQAGNVLNSRQPEVKQQSAEDALASIILG